MQKIYDLNEATANSVGFREGAQRYVESIGTLREATAGLAQQGFKGIEDSIVSLATTGTANFAQFATSLLNDMARIIIQQLVVKQLAQAIGSLFGGPSAGGGFNAFTDFNIGSGFAGGGAASSFAIMPGMGFPGFAKGGVLGANGIVPYAKGGVVTRPMLFPFANGGAIGTGLMGEAGPEAIMPLSRGANGKLGVLAAGGGTTNVVVNVDASGNSSVQGRDDRAGQLGRVISQAVQAELIKQKRRGGILA
jgi:phage-related minor tail protein